MKYTLGDHYIMLNYKVKEEKSSAETNKHRANIPKINIDPKLRLSALSSISDGSSYFRDRINNLEKSIDSNRINLNTIDSTETNKLKDYLSKNLENEIKSEDGGNDYIINLINLFIENKWNSLIDQLLTYIFKTTTLTGFEMNIPFLIDIYKIGCNNENQSIKSKVYQYLQNNNFESYMTNSIQVLIRDIPELNMINNEQPPQLPQLPSQHNRSLEQFNMSEIKSIHEQHNIHTLSDLQESPGLPSGLSISENIKSVPSIHQNKSYSNNRTSSIVQPVQEVGITTLKKPFVSSNDSPLRYIKMDNGLVYIFGVLEVGNVSSMADQNQKTLFKLSPDCCPNYKLTLFLYEENTSFSSFGRGDKNIVKVLIHTDGRVNYVSDDVLNWNSNKIRLYFDGTIIY